MVSLASVNRVLLRVIWAGLTIDKFLRVLFPYCVLVLRVAMISRGKMVTSFKGVASALSDLPLLLSLLRLDFEVWTQMHRFCRIHWPVKSCKTLSFISLLLLDKGFLFLFALPQKFFCLSHFLIKINSIDCHFLILGSLFGFKHFPLPFNLQQNLSWVDGKSLGDIHGFINTHHLLSKVKHVVP